MSESIPMPRVVARAATICLLLWGALLLLHREYAQLGSGDGWINGPIEGLLAFILAGAFVGSLDRCFQHLSARAFAWGALSGAASWLLGGILLYGVILLGDSQDRLPLAWFVSGGDDLVLVFSPLSVLAGGAVGLVLGMLQTNGPRADEWKQRGWVLWSTACGGVAWAFVPMGFVSG